MPSIYFAIYRHTYRTYLHKLCNTDEPTHPRVGHLARLPPFILTHLSHACLRTDCVLHERSFRYIVCFTLSSCSFSHYLAHSLPLFLSLSRVYNLAGLHSFATAVCDVCDVCLVFACISLFCENFVYVYLFLYTVICNFFGWLWRFFSCFFFLQPVVAHLNTISL